MNKLNSKFIQTPSLPQNKITSAIIGERYNKFSTQLEKNGIKIFCAINNAEINPCASNHADMAAFYYGNGKILLEKSQKKLFDELKKSGFEVSFSKKSASGDYPYDILLNSFVLNGKLYCKKEYTDPNILSEYNNIESIKQGYGKCSVFIANRNSVITDDISIYKSLEKNSVNCILIDKGDIFLDGTHYGFIGGSSFMYDKSTAVFFGKLENHRNCHLIKSFLLNIGISCENLSNDTLTDIGGIVPLTEKTE